MAEKTQEELAAEQKALEEKKKKEEDEKKAKELEEEEKLKKFMGDKEAILSLLDAKRSANKEAQTYRLKLEEIEKKQKEAEDKALAEQGKHKELAEKAKLELADKEQKFKNQLILQVLKSEALQQGIIDMDLVKLIDTSGIKVNDDFSVEGTKEAVEDFKEKKPDFFKKEEGGTGRQPEGSTKPGLRSKVVGTLEGLSPREKIARGLETKK